MREDFEKAAYHRINLHPFFFFYALNMVAFSLLAICILWRSNGFWISFLITILVLIPLVSLVWSHVRFKKWIPEDE
jgi:hypothetical protein